MIDRARSERRICIHGHFYQPPRENPWTGRIDIEPSAAPWDNWNDRITDECYAPNTAAEVRRPDGETGRHDNFADISYNVGPTLLAWLESERPDVYRAIVAADAAGASRYSGHGGAIAQGHDHVILPLADDRDRRTQVLWGLADFRRRFGREARGLWLPETAVDLPSLEALAEAGVEFTLLAPHQAARVRGPGDSGWTDVTADSVDTGRAYRQRLPSGREIALFFYDGVLARGVAFDGMLNDGATFAARLEDAAAAASGPRLAHLATDGESYGHHHRHGEMALAWALEAITRDGRSGLTNYGEWLDRHPPEAEVEILERTSWSCAHGVLRWAGGCDCGTGGDSWDYGWRAPLRRALDTLRDVLAARFEAEAGRLLHDPWAARDEYASVRSASAAVEGDATVREWWARHLRPASDTGAASSEARRLLEMQACAMRMYTSCGWFFDDPAGLETRQVLRYAARALDLAGAIDEPVTADWMESLRGIRSNRSRSWSAAGEVWRILRDDRSGVALSRSAW